MKSNNQNKAHYESPMCEEILVNTTAVMCVSDTGIDPIEEGSEYDF